MSANKICKLTTIKDEIYPVGSIYVCLSEVNPEELFGGSWERIENRFLLASGQQLVNTLGGSDTHSHGYRIGYRSYYQNLCGPSDNFIRSYDYLEKKWVGGSGDNGLKTDDCMVNRATTKSVEDVPTATALSVYSHTTQDSILPPYLTVYMWKRVS